MSTTSSTQDGRQLAGTRWRIDPAGSSTVSDQGGGRLRVEGELEAAGERARLHVDVTVRHAGGRLELDAAATVDHRQLGMTWSPLGVIRTPTALSVHARLRRES